MTEYDTHVRSGIDLGDENYAFVTYWNPADESVVAYPVGAITPNGSVLIGIMHYHRNSKGVWCGGYVRFENVPAAHAAQHKFKDGEPLHTLIQADPLTIVPSLLCSCGHHGFVRNGRWQAA